MSDEQTPTKPHGWLRTTAQITCFLLAAVTLSGCIVAPYPGYYRPHYWYRY